MPLFPKSQHQTDVLTTVAWQFPVFEDQSSSTNTPPRSLLTAVTSVKKMGSYPPNLAFSFPEQFRSD